MSEFQCKLSQDGSLITCGDLGKYSEYEEQLWELFLHTYEYVVILAKRSQGYYLLTTAYPVDHPHRREDLLAEYHKYMQSKQRIRF